MTRKHALGLAFAAFAIVFTVSYESLIIPAYKWYVRTPEQRVEAAGPTEPDRPPRPATGDLARALVPTTVAVTEAAWDVMLESQAARDGRGLRIMEEQGQIFRIQEGTQLLVLDQTFLSTKVRVVDGVNEGKAGWVQYEYVEKLSPFD